MKYITNRLPLSQVYPSIICILCFYYLINLNLDISLILNCLNKYNIKYVIFSILLIYCCNILSSSRFKYILQQEGYCVPFKLIHKVNIYSLLNGMIFINFIGNSITRAKILNSHSVPEQIIFTITILEKLMGVIVLIMLSVTLTLISERHLANEIFTNNYYLLNYIIGGTWLLLGVYYLLKKDKIIDHLNLTYILTKKNCLVILITLLLTVLSYVCMACVYIAVAFSINNKIPIIPFLSKVPLVMLAASLPITINGWGLRELVSIALFSKINISSEVAIAISVAIGFLNLITTFISFIYQHYFNKKIILRLSNSNITTNKFAKSNSPSSITHMSLDFITIGFLIGLFMVFKLNFNKTTINIAYIDFFSIFFAIIFISTNYILKTRLFLIFLLYSCLILVSLAIGYIYFGSNSWAYTNKFLGWFVLWAYIVSGIYIAKNDSIITKNGYLLKLFAFIGLLVACYDNLLCFLELILGYPIWQQAFRSEAINGFLQNRNAFAYILCIVYSILITSGNTWFNNCKWILVTGFIVASILFTGSRTGLITIIILHISTLCLNCITLQQFVSIIVALMCWVGTIKYLPCLSLKFSSNLLGFSNAIIPVQLAYDSSVVERWRTIIEGLKMWAHNPIFGQGLGAYIQKEMLENNVPLIIHNTYVWILAEFGIVGFLSYLTALAMICNEILKLFKSPFTTRSGILLLLLVINFLLYSLAHEMLYQRVHWFLIAYVLTHSFRPLVTTNCSIK